MDRKSNHLGTLMNGQVSSPNLAKPRYIPSPTSYDPFPNKLLLQLSYLSTYHTNTQAGPEDRKRKETMKERGTLHWLQGPSTKEASETVGIVAELYPCRLKSRPEVPVATEYILRWKKNFPLPAEYVLLVPLPSSILAHRPSSSLASVTTLDPQAASEPTLAVANCHCSQQKMGLSMTLDCVWHLWREQSGRSGLMQVEMGRTQESDDKSDQNQACEERQKPRQRANRSTQRAELPACLGVCLNSKF